MRRLAAAVSAIFHPLIMPLLCIAIAGEYDWYVRGRINTEQLRITYLVVALSTVAFPGINILLLRWYGAVNSLQLPTRKERFAPFVSSIFFFALGYVLLRRGGLPSPIYSILLGCIASLVVLALINMRIKVSAHAAGIAGLLGCTLALFRLNQWAHLPLLMAIILCCGLVFSARILLDAHTPKEVYSGALIGFAVLYLSVSKQWII